MRIFFDNNLSPKIARAFDEVVRPEHSSIHLKSAFEESELDEVWLSKLAADGDWIVICGEWAMSKRRQIKQIYRNSNLSVFFLSDGWINTRQYEKVGGLFLCLEDMLECARSSGAGNAFRVTQRRKVVRL